MFKRRKIDLSMINPSSKIALKLSCLQQTNGDVKKAEELYNFLADGIESMPDYPSQQPSVLQQIQQTAGGIFNWVKENQGDIVNAYNFMQQVRNGVSSASSAVSDIPPLPPME